MKFGVCVMANIDEIGFFSHVETLGYNSVWVADSQMLFSDCYAVLALAARQTSKLKLGTGTAITGTRMEGEIFYLGVARAFRRCRRPPRRR